MSRKMFPVEESFAAWRKDPEYEKAYNAFKEEFAVAAAMIEVRARAGLTQQLAQGMHTTQAVIARLEAAGLSHRRTRSNASPRRPACLCAFQSSRRPRAEFIRTGMACRAGAQTPSQEIIDRLPVVRPGIAHVHLSHGRR